MEHLLALVLAMACTTWSATVQETNWQEYQILNTHGMEWKMTSKFQKWIILASSCVSDMQFWNISSWDVSASKPIKQPIPITFWPYYCFPRLPESQGYNDQIFLLLVRGAIKFEPPQKKSGKNLKDEMISDYLENFWMFLTWFYTGDKLLILQGWEKFDLLLTTPH